MRLCRAFFRVHANVYGCRTGISEGVKIHAYLVDKCEYLYNINEKNPGIHTIVCKTEIVIFCVML